MKKYFKIGADEGGFTLIELLIVIAILGVLAVVVLIAINPAEQLARTRDAGRISTIAQLGHSVQAYYTGNNAAYPTEAAWSTQLVSSGELSTFPAAIAYPSGFTRCTENEAPTNTGLCYDLGTTATGAVVYSRLESQQQSNKCGTAASYLSYAIFSTGAARGGVICDADNDIDPATTYTFVQ